MKAKCSLIVCLNIYPWCPEKFEYELKTATLSEIDSYTLKYKDKFHLFEAIKAEILKGISRKYLEGIGVNPIDIELTGKGIYVKKNDKDIQALFKNIFVGDKSYPLESIVISSMLKGSLDAFYKCDKKRSENIIYDSFFEGNLNGVAERLEVEPLRNSDYSFVYHELSTKKRFCEVLRFLLLNPNKYDFADLYQIYTAEVPELEEEIGLFDSVPQYEERRYYYRYPYKDD